MIPRRVTGSARRDVRARRLAVSGGECPTKIEHAMVTLGWWVTGADHGWLSLPSLDSAIEWDCHLGTDMT